MAVINVDFKKLEKLSGHNEKKIIECLTNLGMPVEPGEEGGLVVEVTPNRPDLFCIEGIVRAVKAYYGDVLPPYKAAPSNYVMEVEKETSKIRPAVCAAVVKGLDVDEDFLVDLMQMQEKLHDTIGRKRKKVAVGIHDLSKIKGRMRYFVSHGEKFSPLDMEGEMDVAEILEKHPKGRAFAHLVEKGAVLISDEEGIFSFPPIINGERTRVTSKTKEVLVESTGTSQETVEKTVNIIATALADRGGRVYAVKVGCKTFPDFSPARVKMELNEANRVLGLGLSEKEASDALGKMGMGTEQGKVLVPPYRTDIISFTDIIEEIAIGYGYENLEPSLPSISTVGGGDESEEQFHDALTGMGFLETKNYFLTNMEKLNAVGRGRGALGIKNSASEEFTFLRTSLLPGIMGCFSTNKMKGLPQLFYEIGTVYTKKEEERLCFGIMGEGASVTTLQPYLQTLIKEVGKKFRLKEAEDKCFIKGRCAKISIGKEDIGIIGSVHPETLEKFGLGHAVAVCEIDVSKLI
ncbi:phenylalanine--tRNA ligase subunit beta [Candidatus Micrarchaeota archaeon]|nr:phenylalanine--tRNA ligase subunit beta [Candidatus Micrarchaeota archaeon]MBD3417729.1 phenylalanine--tRNA ligase subunit beta [Candidatus Micrarchaeota archaeon]